MNFLYNIAQCHYNFSQCLEFKRRIETAGLAAGTAGTTCKLTEVEVFEIYCMINPLVFYVWFVLFSISRSNKIARILHANFKDEYVG